MKKSDWETLIQYKLGKYEGDCREWFGCDVEQVEREVSDSRTEQQNKERGYSESRIRAGIAYMKRQIKNA